MAANEPRLRVRRPVTERESEPPWRVEGEREPRNRRRTARSRSAGSCSRGGSAVVFAVLLVINYWIGSTVPDRAPRLEASYTLFVNQVQGGNVSEMTARGDTIQGDFKKPVPDPKSRPARTRRRSSGSRP